MFSFQKFYLKNSFKLVKYNFVLIKTSTQIFTLYDVTILARYFKKSFYISKIYTI